VAIAWAAGNTSLGIVDRGQEADPRGLVAVDQAAGEQELGGAGDADQARQEVRDRHAGVQAEAREVGAVARPARAQAQVAAQREAEATADGVAVERADHRHLEVQHRQERLVHREALLVRGLGRAVVADHRALEVGAGREARAGAGDDQAAQLAGRPRPPPPPRRRRRAARGSCCCGWRGDRG
jgi:hypothetical protein